MRICIRPEDLRNPADSDETLVSIETVRDCDGVACNTAVTDDDGQLVSCIPHTRGLRDIIRPISLLS